MIDPTCDRPDNAASEPAVEMPIGNRQGRKIVKWDDSLRLSLLMSAYIVGGHTWTGAFERIPQKNLMDHFLGKHPELRDKVSFRKLKDNTRTYSVRYP